MTFKHCFLFDPQSASDNLLAQQAFSSNICLAMCILSISVCSFSSAECEAALAPQSHRATTGLIYNGVVPDRACPGFAYLPVHVISDMSGSFCLAPICRASSIPRAESAADKPKAVELSLNTMTSSLQAHCGSRLTGHRLQCMTAGSGEAD